MPSNLRSLPINIIRIIEGTPPCKQDRIAKLQSSIEDHTKLGHGDNGLLVPIKVYAERKFGSREAIYWLLDGNDRLNVFNLLGRTRIQAEVYEDISWDRAHLIRIDSNLFVEPRDVIEQGKMIAERDEILIRLGLRAVRGDNDHTLSRKKGSLTGRDLEVVTTPELAKQHNIGISTLYRYKQIATKLSPQAEEVVRELELENSSRLLLDVIAGETPEEQVQIARQIVEEREQRKATRPLESKGARPKQSSTSEEVPPVPFNPAAFKPITISFGDWWQINLRHHVFCGSTSGGEFAERAPEAALAIAPLLEFDEDRPTWSYDWMLEKADVVAVPAVAENVWAFTQATQMQHYRGVIQFWLYENNSSRPSLCIPTFVFSKDVDIKLPTTPIRIVSWQNLYRELLGMYTPSDGDRVICPMFKNADLLTVADQSKRFCYLGGDDPELCSKIVTDWRKATSNPARKIDGLQLAAIAG